MQVLPAQPSMRVKREGSTQSFKSPLDQANASSDQSSSELTSSNGSTDRSNIKFYNVSYCVVSCPAHHTS